MIRAVIADDSALLRQVLKDVLEASKRIQVVGAGVNGKEAVDLVKKLHPDILVLDCEMPVMNGLEALRHIMQECPLPVFMFSSLTSEGASVTIRALEYGAVDFLCKPARGVAGLDEVAKELIRKIECIVLKEKFKTLTARKTDGAVRRAPGTITQVPQRTVDIIAMGSSTGGVQASTKVITGLPKDTKPIVWVQHMPPQFTLNFANRLDGLSALRVKEAEDGDVVEHGTCYLAPGGLHMRVKKKGSKTVLDIQDGEKVSGHRPSCNVLFDSIAEYYESNVMGIILTGMGDDGAQGLQKLHARGAYVIGQSEASCVVYGMPKSAYQLGAVDIELDIEVIATAIKKAGG